LKFPEIEVKIIDTYPGDEQIKELEGKGLVFHDIHHGTALYLHKAKLPDIKRLLHRLRPDGVIIVL
jgi:hypothetical protein